MQSVNLERVVESLEALVLIAGGGMLLKTEPTFRQDSIQNIYKPLTEVPVSAVPLSKTEPTFRQDSIQNIYKPLTEVPVSAVPLSKITFLNFSSQQTSQYSSVRPIIDWDVLEMKEELIHHGYFKSQNINVLETDDKDTFEVIDGQHRVKALKNIFARGSESHGEAFTNLALLNSVEPLIPCQVINAKSMTPKKVRKLSRDVNAAKRLGDPTSIFSMMLALMEEFNNQLFTNSRLCLAIRGDPNGNDVANTNLVAAMVTAFDKAQFKPKPRTQMMELCRLAIRLWEMGLMDSLQFGKIVDPYSRLHKFSQSEWKSITETLNNHYKFMVQGLKFTYDEARKVLRLMMQASILEECIVPEKLDTPKREWSSKMKIYKTLEWSDNFAKYPENGKIPKEMPKESSAKEKGKRKASDAPPTTKKGKKTHVVTTNSTEDELTEIAESANTSRMTTGGKSINANPPRPTTGEICPRASSTDDQVATQEMAINPTRKPPAGKSPRFIPTPTTARKTPAGKSPKVIPPPASADTVDKEKTLDDDNSDSSSSYKSRKRPALYRYAKTSTHFIATYLKIKCKKSHALYRNLLKN